MEAGNREEEDRYFGATLPATHSLDSQPASPTRLPLPTPPQHHHHQQQQQQQPDQEEPQEQQQLHYHHYRHHHHGHHHHHHHHQQNPHPPSPGLLDSPDIQSLGAFDYHQHPLISSQFVAYASSNFEAANANATSSIEPLGFVDPDDFYRTYSLDSGHQVDELMASSLPVSRHNRDASLRSNGNSSSPKNPTSPSPRNGLRPVLRSVSAPVDDKSSPGILKPRTAAVATTGSGARSGHQPSVKDLKKRFDQSTAQSSGTTSRKTTPRIPTRETSSVSGHRGVGSPPSTNGQSYAALRSSVTRDLPSGTGASSTTRSTQRNKSVAEDQLSSNAQSFASRIAKPRHSVGSQSQASKSMTNLSPTSSPGSVPPVPPSRDLLFGEIVPGEMGTGLAGFGIDSHRARRTSEPDIERPSARRQRSLSHADAEPSSPSDWYRGTNGELPARNNTDAVRPKPHKGHSRSRSDLAGAKLNPPISRTAQAPRPRPTLDMSTLSSSSRLPVSVRKLNSPSGSSSPASTRSNSPTVRKRHPAQGKLSKPTSSTRAKTPTNNPSNTSRRQNKLGAVTPNNNTRLNAYISAPPPKLSPPLRSSRPRQPVSSATTTSSRMRTVERGRSPLKYDSKPGTKHNESARRRKISMGPIDFESRREQIKLSYTKSIRESEARAAARRLADEKRKKAEDVAKAEYAAAEALKRREEKLQEEFASDSTQSPVDAEASPVESAQDITTGLVIESPTDGEAPIAELPPMPTITTELLRQVQPSVTAEDKAKLKDSPTLGIPGTFPSPEILEDQEEAPPSAVSNTTEFDAEPQTEPPVQEIPVRQDANPVVNLDDYAQSSQPQSEYRSPFGDTLPNDDSESIKISLDASTEVEPVQCSEPTKPTTDLDASPEILSSYKDDEYEPRPLPPQTCETKVTIVGRNSDFSPSSREVHDISTFAEPSESRVPGEAENQPSTPTGSSDSSCSDKASPNDEPVAPGADFSEVEQFYVGPIIKDPAVPSQASTTKPGGSSDETAMSTQHAAEELRFSMDSRRTMGTRPSLTVPRTSSSMNRTSQTTIWTDYSVSSQDVYSKFASRDLDFEYRNSAYTDDHAVSESDSRSQSLQYERPSRDITSSREVSPRGTYQDSETLYDQHQLPEIDTGEGFVVNYMSRKNSSTFASVPVVPNRTPPPPPDEISLRDISSATPSEYIDETRPNSYLLAGKDNHSLFSIDPSRRESDDFPHSGSTTRSIDQGSLEISDGLRSASSRLDSQQTLAESIDQVPEGLSDKERKRLFTRLETIKELIDTEAFFIRDMNIVEEIYKGTAEACPRLDDNTIKLIFRNTDQIIKFHSEFLSELKVGVSSVYTPKSHRANLPKGESPSLNDGTVSITSSPATATGHLSDDKDRETSLGPIFTRNMERMKTAHETFLKNSDHAAKRLIQIQEDPTVQVWLNECNEVARDLTKAWNLDSLLIKPMQRITKYPNLLIQLLHETPADHPDRPLLESAKASLEDAIEEINKTKKNFELVGQIVGRKRKESDVKAGFARAFGKRVDKLQATTNRPTEDPEYLKLHEKFGDDYLRLQVVLRDVEFYTRQVTEYVHEFLQYLSSMELVMRLQPSPHPEIESKWVRFNVSMRDIEKVALEQHLSQVRKQVIEPFELVIKSYGNPSLAMKKRAKRRLDYEKSIQLKKSGKKVDKQLIEFIEQYEALNEALKKELPKLSALTEKVGNICLGNFVNIQAEWFSIWKEKVKVVIGGPETPEISDIITTFQRDFKFQDEQMNTFSIVKLGSKGRPSQSASVDEASGRLRPRLADLDPRSRGLSVNSDIAPSLPTPDFMKRHSGQFTVSPSAASVPSPHQYYYRDFYAGTNGQTRPGPSSPTATEFTACFRSLAAPSIRPGTGQSHDSGGAPRQSIETGSQSRPYSNSTYQSSQQSHDNQQRFSGLFQSALPPSEGPERLPRPSQASSRASSRERKPINGYNVLWLAASLFEFNIETTKHEAGYPYLTYQAGEIFDVIAEKGELWLAKNQDDPNNLVGWLWSKHFAKLADD